MEVVENRATRGSQSDCRLAKKKKGHGARQTQHVPHAETRHLSKKREQIGGESGKLKALTDHARIEPISSRWESKINRHNSNRPLSWAFGHVVRGRERSPALLQLHI